MIRIRRFHAALCGVLFLSFAHATDADPFVRPPTTLDTSASAIVEAAVSSDAELSIVLYTETGGDPLLFQRSDGRGLDWSAPQVLPGSLGAPKHVQRDSVQVIGTRAFAVWSDDALGSASTTIRVARYSNATWSAPVLVNAGLPGGADVTAWHMAARTGPSGDVHVYVLASVRDAAVGAPDQLYLLVSADAGATFQPAVAVSSSVTAADVDGFGLDVQDDRLLVTWTDDRVAAFTPGSGNDLWLRSATVSSVGGVAWSGAEQQMDTPLGASISDVDGDPVVAIEGSKLGLAWREDTLANGKDRLLIRRSDDSGATWSNPALVGGYAPGFHAVGSFDFELVGEAWTLAWDDDRSGAPQVYRAETKTGPGMPETQISFNGGREPKISRTRGMPFGAAVVYIEDTLNGPMPAVSFADQDGGAEWHEFPVPLAMPASFGGGAVTSPDVAYNHRYYNFVIPFLAQSAALGSTQDLYITGFRPPTVYPVGFAAGPASPWFELGHVPFEDLFGFVLVATQPATGQLVLPDGRETGLAFDLLTTFGLQNFQLFFAPNDAAARGVLTPSLTTNLPVGFDFWATGLTIGSDLGLRHITDRVHVQL